MKKICQKISIEIKLKIKNCMKDSKSQKCMLLKIKQLFSNFSNFLKSRYLYTSQMEASELILCICH